MALERELETYWSRLPELTTNQGKYVLIRGDAIVDVFSTYEDAIKEGYAKFQLGPFLVKQIHAAEPIQFVSRLLPCHTSPRQVAPDGGLIVRGVVGVSQARRKALLAANQPVPQTITVDALIDTGASCTCVDPSVLRQLGLTPTGNAQIHTPSTGGQAVMVDQFDVSLMILTAPNLLPLIHQTMPVVGADLLTQHGFHALLGRDVLRGCLYDL